MFPQQIAIIGLGYVGLPLAMEFAGYFKVFGYDINADKIRKIQNRESVILSSSEQEKLSSLIAKHTTETNGLHLTSSLKDISQANIFIITVPTPVKEYNIPDLSFLLKATESIGSVLKSGDIVIYESTVYPGCTEEDCIPILEKNSGLKFNKDFFVGYSPERINPGDKIHTLTTIKKVTSGSTPEIAEKIDQLYKTIITAGTYKAPSIRVAEASKAIENAQRDINISFVNELALIFDRMGIDTNDVLDAAATKFNFLKFKPGLVGGHCISVDPYYLAFKAQSLGYLPQVILSGRRVNDHIPEFIAGKVVKLLINKNIQVKDAKILILGITFKENCADIRNSRVADVYKELKQYGTSVDVYDPYANEEEVKQEYNIQLLKKISNTVKYNGIILAVAHDDFRNFNFEEYKSEGTVIFDTKAFIPRNMVDARL